MNKSIASKMFRWNVTLVVLVLVIAMVGGNLFSEQVYKQKTLQLVNEEVEKLEQFIEMGDVESAIETIDESAFRLGGTVALYSSDDELLYASYQMTPGNGQGMMRGQGYGKEKGSVALEKEIPEERLYETITGSGKNMVYYKKTITSDAILYIQFPMEKIDDALWVFQQLLLYVSVVGIVIAVGGSIFMARHFSKPVIELNDLAEKITTLDFSGRYREVRHDEIGQLGNSLNQLSAELERTIEQLRLELDKEKTMDSLRTQFVAQASHELQTPLTVLKNYIEVLEDGLISSEEMGEHLGIMIEEVDDMSEMVVGLLDLSQLRSGQFRIEFADFDIVELVTSECSIFKERCDQLNITLNTVLPTESAIIHGDPKRIKQGARNLMENALKHSSGTIDIYGVIAGHQFTFAVENSGEKIKTSELETLWEVFYKEEGNHKKGSGLGLAITKEILERHGGRYGVENTDNGVKSHFSLEIID